MTATIADMRVRRHGEEGFTLLEVVLAVGLSMLLMGAVLAFYQYALDSRKLVLSQVQRVAQRRGVMERMTDELRCALSCLTLEGVRIGMEGVEDSMEFPCAVVPGPAAWSEPDVAAAGPPAEQDVQVIGYRIRQYVDQDGNLHIEGLERTRRKVVTWRSPDQEPGPETQARLLSPDVRFLRVRYWTQSAEQGWLESWGGGDLPLAVEVALGMEPLPQGLLPMEYPYELFRRVVFIPAAARPARAQAGE